MWLGQWRVTAKLGDVEVTTLGPDLSDARAVGASGQVGTA